MHFIDSHCHLDFDVLSRRLTSILQASQEKGVAEYVVPSVTRQNIPTVIDLAQCHPQIHIALGLHPCFVREHRAEDIDYLTLQLTQYSCCAVGEIGLDFFIDDPRPEKQIALFEQQLLLAKSFHLPVILHVRKAHDDVLMRLKSLSFAEGGIVHAFNGSEQQARRYTEEFGFKLGFGGAITYPRAHKLRRLAATLPLDSLVLETDAPDMPLAGDSISYNRPENIVRVAAQLAILREVSMEELAPQLLKNTRQALNLLAV